MHPFNGTNRIRLGAASRTRTLVRLRFKVALTMDTRFISGLSDSRIIDLGRSGKESLSGHTPFLWVTRR